MEEIEQLLTRVIDLLERLTGMAITNENRMALMQELLRRKVLDVVPRPPTFAMPSEITEQIIALTDFRRNAWGLRDDEKAAMFARESRIESMIPGYCLVWNADILAYGIFPESRCDGGRMGRSDDKETP